MKGKKLMLVLMALACIPQAWAYDAKVRVVNPQGDPEAYATCRIFNASDSIHALSGGVTDTLGIYKASLKGPGKYRMAVEVVGAQPQLRVFELTEQKRSADLGTVTVDASELGEVVVTAQRPLVVKEIDRIGYDVQADEDSKTSTVNEILRKVPMVNVDADGSITINGSSNFKIYKNGRPNSSMSKNAKDLFKALPASMIKTIEVITEPGAKYDAEGVAAILNIVTVENTVVKGVMGNASVRGSSLVPFESANLWLTSQIDKVTFSVNGGTQYMSSKGSRNVNTSDYLYENGTRRISQTESSNKGWATWGGLEASYEMDTLNLFTAEANLFYYNVVPRGTHATSLTAADGTILSSYKSNLFYPDYNYLDLDATFSYQRSTRRKGETLALSYMISNSGNDNHEQETYSDIVGDMFPYTARDNKYKLHFIEHTFQFDWSRPLLKNHTLDLGAKYVLRRNHSKSDYNYVDWQLQHTDFLHVTNIGAAYFQYSLRLGKVGLRAGLRYEFSQLKASYPNPSIPESADTPFSQSLNDWVPTAAASWQINDANSLTLNYSTRISRPGIQWLNPAKTISPTTVSMGNPDLESARYQSIKLAYTLIKQNFNMSLDARYSFSSNAVADVNYLKDNIIYSTFANIGTERTLSFSGYTQWSPGKKTRIMLNLGANRNYYAQDDISQAHWSWYAYATVTQKLPWKIEASAMVYIMGQWMWDVYSRNTTPFGDRLITNLTLKRNFLKDDRLSVGITWNGIGKPHRLYRNEYFKGPYTGVSNSYNYNNQKVMLSVSYRFGSLNASVKKTKARVANDDLGGQKSGGSSQQ